MSSEIQVTKSAKQIVATLDELSQDTAISQTDLEERIRNVITEAFNQSTDQRRLATTLVALLATENARQKREIDDLKDRVTNLTDTTRKLGERLAKAENEIRRLKRKDYSQFEKARQTEANRTIVYGIALVILGLVVRAAHPPQTSIIGAIISTNGACYSGYGLVKKIPIKRADP